MADNNKNIKLIVTVAAIVIPLISYIGTSAVLFHRVGQLEQQDTSKLEERISTQWSILGELRRNLAEVAVELKYTKYRLDNLEDME